MIEGSCSVTQELSLVLCDDERSGAGGGEVGGRFKRERIYVYLRLIHDVIRQKPTQHCKEIILQLQIN